MMPDVDQPLRLAEQLAARLCHDLASPVGVLAGLLELARDNSDAEALHDAGVATAQLACRLRLLRAAWAGAPAPMSVADLHDLAGGLFRHGQARLDLGGLASAPGFTPEAGRLVLNLLLLGADALGGPGSLHLSGVADQEVALRIAGPRAAWPAGLLACLRDPAAAWEHLGGPRTIQMPLTILLAAGGGHALSMPMPLTAAADTLPPLLLRLT